MIEDHQEGPAEIQKAEVNSHPEKNLRLYAACGVIAPIFFGLMVIIEGFLVPGYSWVSQPISDLGAFSLYGSYAILQTLNFWVFGALVFVFALGLRSTLMGSRALVTTLALFGLMAFLAGVFSDQPYPFPGDAHVLVSAVAFTLIILCQFIAWKRLRRTSSGSVGEGWGLYAKYSLVSGILSVVFFSPIGAFGADYQGIWQRLFIVVPWLWIEVMALRVLRLSRTAN